MLQNAYFLAKIGADTAENEQHFAEIGWFGLELERRRRRGGAAAAEDDLRGHGEFDVVARTDPKAKAGPSAPDASRVRAFANRKRFGCRTLTCRLGSGNCAADPVRSSGSKKRTVSQ